MSRSNPDFLERRDTSGVVWVRKDFFEALKDFGLGAYAEWMGLEDVPFREVSMRPTRPVVGLRLPGVAKQLYLKRHLEPARPSGPVEKFRFRRPRTEGRKEAEIFSGFSEAGVPTPRVVAWGEGAWEGIRTASFIATEDLESLPLERYLFHHWQPPVRGRALADKRQVLRLLAELTRKMHRAGWVHRDYYLGHVFVHGEDEGEEGRLSVIDVQRADRRPAYWGRSKIKDLASLHFSADPKYIHWSDRLRFIKAYWEVDRFSRWQRFKIRWILKKADRIRRHTEKSMGIPYSDFFKNKYY